MMKNKTVFAFSLSVILAASVSPIRAWYTCEGANEGDGYEGACQAGAAYVRYDSATPDDIDFGINEILDATYYNRLHVFEEMQFFEQYGGSLWLDGNLGYAHAWCS
jgi:hypothetical protein